MSNKQTIERIFSSITSYILFYCYRKSQRIIRIYHFWFTRAYFKIHLDPLRILRKTFTFFFFLPRIKNIQILQYTQTKKKKRKRQHKSNIQKRNPIQRASHSTPFAREFIEAQISRRHAFSSILFLSREEKKGDFFLRCSRKKVKWIVTLRFFDALTNSRHLGNQSLLMLAVVMPVLQLFFFLALFGDWIFLSFFDPLVYAR